MHQLHSHNTGLKSVRKAIRLPLLCCALLALHSPKANAALAGGTYSINPSGTASATVYKSLTDAISDMTAGTRADGGTPNGVGISGAVVFELAAGYTSTGETFPLTFTNITGTSAGNTITVRPAAGVSSPLVLSSGSGATVLLDAAQYIVFDGRPGGAGSNKYLEIDNTNTGAYTLTFLNSASNNIARFCTFRSVRTSSSGVFFGAAGSGSGNDNNVIDHSNIEIGTSPSAYGIMSMGTSGSENSGNVISNCNISNFRSVGIYLAGNSTNWTIADNSIYQTSSLATTGSTDLKGIQIFSGGGHNITGNFIGGSQPRCAGSAWTVTGANSNIFKGIHMNSANAVANTISSNTIANISIESTNGNPFNAIQIDDDLVNITGNTIGSATGNASINVIYGGSGSPYICGIAKLLVSKNANVQNNIIGSITATSTTARGISIYGIRLSYGTGTTNTVSGNRIGSTTTANSLYASSANTAGTQNVVGIGYTSASAVPLTISNNTIANLTNNSAIASNSSGGVTGIEAATTITSITGNTIFNLNSPSTANSAVIGINATGSSTVLTSVSFNKISNLVGADVRGMNLYGASGLVNGNLIHSFAFNSSASFPLMFGIMNNSATLVYTNNMLRLGLNAAGTSIANGSIIGIYSSASSANLYHNTVYIGGSGVTGGTSSAFECFDISALSVNAENNIFVNARANGSGTGYHTATGYDPLPNAGTINNNLLYAPNGSLAVIGAVTHYATLSDWQTASSFDASSVAADPLFVNANGNADSFDLHLDFGTPAEKSITAITGVTTDYDGESRASFGDMHIGADASHFNGVKWNGNSSTVWSNNANWDGGVAPTSTENALIPAGLTNYPEISTGSVNLASLLVAKGGSVKISGSAMLQLSGVITNKDTIDAKAGIIMLSDASVRHIAAGVLDVHMLAVNNSAGVILRSGKVNVHNSYMPIGGQLTTNGNLVLKSTANGTANIGSSVGGNGNYISGDVVVERYIPGKRAFRFLSHPFSHGIAMSELTDDIDITGTGGAPFTPTGTNNPSAFYFNAETGDNSTTGVNPGWAPFTASSLLNRYQAMRVLVRGAKGEGLNGNSYTPSATTIDMVGTPNQGTVTMSLTKGANTDFVLAGNPFPSAVQMNLVANTGVGSGYMLWDANQGVNGGYTSSYFFMPAVLPAGSAFFTTLTAPSASLVFEEGDKSTSTANTTFKGTQSNHIVELSLQDSTIFWDRLLLNFDSSAMATIGNLDMAKFYNPDMSFYTLSKDDSMLSIDARPFTDKEVIKLGLYSTINKNFKITVPQYSTPAGTKVYLKDNYLNTTQEITGVGYTYWFATSADKKSWGNDRFELFTEVTPVGIVEAQPASNLKVKLAPNPASNEVNIYCEGMNGKTATITIMNMMGVQVAAGSTSTGHLNVPMQQIPAGMYTVTIQCGGQTITQKLIKK